MTTGEAPAPPTQELPKSGTFTKCPRCSMEVRDTELQIHLAHAHNIGPDTDRRERRRNDRGRGRRSRDD